MIMLIYVDFICYIGHLKTLYQIRKILPCCVKDLWGQKSGWGTLTSYIFPTPESQYFKKTWTQFVVCNFPFSVHLYDYEDANVCALYASRWLLQWGNTAGVQSHVSCHRVNCIFGLAKLLKFETFECWSTVRRIVFAGMHLKVCIL